MVRNYKRSTERAAATPTIILQAVKQVKYDRVTLTKTSEDFGIPVRTLARYCQKLSYEELEKMEIDTSYVPNISFGYSKRTQVFTIHLNV